MRSLFICLPLQSLAASSRVNTIKTKTVRPIAPCQPSTPVFFFGILKLILNRYWKDANFAAVDAIRLVAEKNKLTLAEISFRWLTHHSSLKRERGDAIVIGVSSATQLKSNLIDLDKGPLRE